MSKNHLKVILFSFLCVLTMSCSLMTKNTGNIHFMLPDLRENEMSHNARANGSENEMTFKILLKDFRQRVFYEKEHPAKSSVFISDIPVGNYTISIVGETEKNIYSGQENIKVQAGKSVSVNLLLEKSSKPDNKPAPDPEEKPNPSPDPDIGPDPDVKPEPEIQLGYITGKVDLSVLLKDDKNIEIKGTVYKVDDKDNLLDSFVVGADGNFRTSKELAFGNYLISFHGSGAITDYDKKDINAVISTKGDNLISRDVILYKTTTPHIVLRFTTGPETPINLTVKLYKAGVKVNTCLKNDEMMSNDTVTIGNLQAGTDYRIEAEGQNETHKYTCDQNFEVKSAQATNLNLTLNGTLLQETVELPKPDSAQGIYCVDGDNGTDSGNDGSKAFKTISKALKVSGAKTIYVKGTVNEKEQIKLPNGIKITTPGNSVAQVESSLSTPLFIMDSGSNSTIEGLEIIITAGSLTDCAIKMGDSCNLTLGVNTKIDIRCVTKNAISLGSQGTLNISTPNIVGSNKSIYVLSGGKINVLPGFNNIEGSIAIDKTNVGSDNSQIIFYNGKADACADLSAAVKKFTINNNYTINDNGKLIPGGGSGGESGVTSVWSFENLSSNVGNGGKFKIEESNISFNSTLVINKPVTISATKNVSLIRGNELKAPLFQIAAGGSLTIEGTTGGTITIDGNNLDGVAGGLISSEGILKLNNCIVQNNKDSGIVLKGDNLINITNTQIKNNTSVSNGGGIFIENNKLGSPEVILAGNTMISGNKVGANNFGAGVYVKEGYITLQDSAKITVDNVVGTGSVSGKGRALYFQSKSSSSLNAATQGSQQVPVNSVYDDEVTMSTK